MVGAVSATSKGRSIQIHIKEVKPAVVHNISDFLEGATSSSQTLT